MGAKDQGLDHSKHRYRVIPRTLTFITHQGLVLLLRGAPHKPIWAGLYNGLGGHVENDEAILDSARREIAEEAGLTEVHDLRLCGVANITTQDPQTGIMLFIFSVESASIDVQPSHEGELEWVDWRTIPAGELVEDLPQILPRVLSMTDREPPFFAHYWYDENDRLQVAFSP